MIAMFEPCGTVTNTIWAVSPDRSAKRGLVEFQSPREASVALAVMNGFTLCGTPVEVKQPHSFSGSSEPLYADEPKPAEMSTADKEEKIFRAHVNLSKLPGSAALRFSFQHVQTVERTQCRIYVGSVPYNITTADLQTVFRQCGTIRSCTLLPNPETGSHRGYGFIEFETPDAARSAIEKMNGFRIGDRTLRVSTSQPHIAASDQHASSSASSSSTSASTVSAAAPGSTASSSAVARTKLPPAEMRLQLMQKLQRAEDNLVLPGTAAAAAASASKPVPVPADLAADSTVILLTNMIDAAAVDATLNEDVEEECSNFGRVVRVHVYVSPSNNVRVFVQFEDRAAAVAALKALHGRLFAGRRVVGSLYPEAAFLEGQYEHTM
jgi:RNA recognition motif-containing protein